MTTKKQNILLDIYDILEEWREHKSNALEDEKMWLRDKENSKKEETKESIKILEKEVQKAEKGIKFIKELYKD